MCKQFKVLKISSVIFKVLAWISAVFFIVVTFIVLLGFGGPDTPRIASLVFLLGGGLYFLILFSISEGIKLLLSLCARTDKIIELLEGKSTGN